MLRVPPSIRIQREERRRSLRAKLNCPLTIKPPRSGGLVSSRMSLPAGIVTTSPAFGGTPCQVAADDQGSEAVAELPARQRHHASANLATWSGEGVGTIFLCWGINGVEKRTWSQADSALHPPSIRNPRRGYRRRKNIFNLPKIVPAKRSVRQSSRSAGEGDSLPVFPRCMSGTRIEAKHGQPQAHGRATVGALRCASVLRSAGMATACPCLPSRVSSTPESGDLLGSRKPGNGDKNRGLRG
jgi:hypothetical protein